MNKHRIIYNGVFILISSLLWIVLNEKVSWMHFGIGLFLGYIALLLSEKYLTLVNYNEVYRINVNILFKYTLFLVYQIFCSGFSTIKTILTGQVQPGIVLIHTELNNDFLRVMLANSITLTPGTVTLDITDNQLTVLWINCQTNDSLLAGEIIKGSFEKILMEAEICS